MVIVFEELLVKEPPVPIISSEPFVMVSVPVDSVNGMSSVTLIASIIMVSEPVGSTSLLQLSGSDQTPVAPPSQTPLATDADVTSTVTVAVSGVDEPSSDIV